MSTQPREKNPNWKGGRSIASNGYVLVKVGFEHHLADVRGYAYEHRLVAEKKIGRRLRPGEQVHHIDGDTQNNVDDNLEVLTVAEHRAEHRTKDAGLRMPGEPNPVIPCACGCGGRFPRFDDFNRPRSFLSGHNEQEAPTEKAILAVLKEGPLYRGELAAKTGLSVTAVAVCLTKMRRNGIARIERRGVWALVPQETRADG